MTKLQVLCDKLGITCEAKYGGELPEGWAPDAHPWTVTLHRRGVPRRILTTRFYQGSAHTSEPTTADVLACLVSDVPAGEQSFEEFCSDFGYDVDSRKAEKVWEACKAIAPRVRRFLGVDFDAVANAEH